MSEESVSEELRGKGINWTVALFLAFFHICAIAALFFFYMESIYSGNRYVFHTGSFGIGVGFHRLLTHRGYKVVKPLEYFLTVCGTLALEGGPIAWVATHRIHHKYTDKKGDPHSPRDGRWWSHMSWSIFG